MTTLSPLIRRLYKLPHPPTPPSSSSHTTLPSFLAHASRTSLPPTSTTYIGTHYEYTIQSTLRSSALLLHRTGGRSDAGTDLVGTWHLPAHEHPPRVLVQCKALKTKLGPNIVRELEGTFSSAPVGWRGTGVIGMLVSPREATRGVREALTRSRFPLVWCLVGLEGRVRQVLWNERVEGVVGGGLGIGVVYCANEQGDNRDAEARVTWDGEEVPGIDDVVERMEVMQRRWFELWDVGEERWEEVLGVVERLFPFEKPLLYARDGRVSGLSEEERELVRRELKSRST
ncbi:hypothetical protein CBS115989_2369 [Aspergillus niger]|uniref:Restriction endonuclease type IV Mrr domain-containing protein n=1 Tax=Aspergillus niger ATCC 13496 TaxID=1353008 RepID=A0A370CEQ9_ASPNG|nr:hypothetical protein ANI_1_2314024 [Aspergillus niger CBS 513.88]XP_025460347.1 uncharacterized protein BO96DRAFT_452147 [Aspergillus niger CBS 101883]KAI2822058.1 hypothetical protein CBS115989_2369 [Aspergillus niger]RDH25116.1 hypothetical protein M747DRAFT_327754 [Aspergillus niger ATCC 13496]KAI2836023.1 hypothetical protein CBS11350_9664 [Aspergillus niger]KAI2854366.1 hypothetical protein CBS11232_4956 [Aspergillus niger]KAI2878584.1 hypothetical protein CBS115988_3088 [Aspergillus |eukprot:XP_003188605.1 hypothetical protein ANI_1_2314024 [Aspergillus niger CBS 513.88]